MKASSPPIILFTTINFPYSLLIPFNLPGKSPVTSALKLIQILKFPLDF